ncbi:MAG: TetR/AcrR family transcriptional regulator, partial [Moorea sp. SIO3G5]|nr:TetR/AcrR family transcriptional regulator [Moorena sp. SIO3G5]
MVGRKLEFDREEALEKAMDLFWSKGYNATGLNDLLKHMGIQRQSLYNTFGSKHALFLEAVQNYGQTVVCCIEQRLNEPGSPLENIRNLIRGLASDA